MNRFKRGLLALPVMCLGLSSCSPAPTPTANDVPMPVAAPQGAIAQPEATADQAPMREDRQLLQTSVPNKIPTTSRCYTLSTERVIFKVLWVESDNRSDWDTAANGVANTCEGTRVWDDKWYWYFVPADQTKNLMLLWKNIDAAEYGYVVIKNTPSLWLVYTNTAGPFIVKNDEQLKRTWTSNGRRIDIDVKNPNNEGGWTSNDIWVSFGY